jgi:flavin reductase (DIM6/NTAB) family NADH-FMN oxidoreductase RutF
MSEHVHFDLEEGAPLPPQFVRWVQPPQIAYFISSMDKAGNHNIAPVTMGTTMCMHRFYIPFAINHYDAHPRKHSYSNLVETPECVLSYIGADLLEQSWIAALPIPAGISELEVAGLTPLPSKKVKPWGIAECAINIEIKIVSMQELGKNDRMFLGKVVAVSIDAEMLKQNNQKELRTGMTAIDPLFEVLIERPGPDRPPRLYYMKLDREHLYPTSDDIGSNCSWLGTFEEWMNSECERGRIDSQERATVVELWKEWDKDKHPVRNPDAKRQLTDKLRDIVARPKERWARPQ